MVVLKRREVFGNMFHMMKMNICGTLH